ncbi:MAG TPA: retropepsin-like aspartic protease [Phycisphaerae bacterium]|jgi:hypothetical protein|nr:retropepsin-like aspartic protease [Phycisphaerae bacterium]
MPGYEGELFDPPAPIARVTLVNPKTGQMLTDIPMLLDTGADVTLLPLNCRERLGLETRPADPRDSLVGFDGARQQFEEVDAHLVFEGKTFRGTFPLFDNSFGIIGRNVLNLLDLSLSGRQLTWNVM